jgi:hypothetical protein
MKSSGDASVTGGRRDKTVVGILRGERKENQLSHENEN